MKEALMAYGVGAAALGEAQMEHECVRGPKSWKLSNVLQVESFYL